MDVIHSFRQIVNVKCALVGTTGRPRVNGCFMYNSEGGLQIVPLNVSEILK